MKQMEPAQQPASVVAVFGTGQLVQTVHGRLAMRGGTKNDFLEASEWVALFLHEATIERPS